MEIGIHTASERDMRAHLWHKNGDNSQDHYDENDGKASATTSVGGPSDCSLWMSVGRS